ncbi:MAG: hypothetical protein NTW10_10675 [Bacteroidetes bacterium]|nr:hypothetical protein [Bacteroidota bacterium]
MRHLLKLSAALILFGVFFVSLNSEAQTPTYSCVAKNDTLINATTYQFDVYIYQTGSTALYLSTYQLSFQIANSAAILNGGTLSGVYVASSSQLPGGFTPAGMSVFPATNPEEIRINGPTLSSNGTLIPVSGLRIGTFQIINTVSYTQSNMGIIWWNTVPATTYVFAIVPPGVSGTATPITVFPGSHTISFTDPILNAPVTAFNMTGGGTYCSGGSGAAVGLSGSQTGVQYHLLKNATPVGSDIPGTGSALAFGLQTAGTYTSTGYRKATYLTGTMTGSVTVTTVTVTPTITGLSTVCAGSTGVVYTTESGKTNYIWSVSAGGTITSGGTTSSNTATVTWNTAGAQTVSVNYTDAGCTAASATVYPVTVNARPVPTLAGPLSPCIGSTGNVYTTEAGQTSYVWTVSAGGTITAGGTATSNTATITWNSAGAQSVTVNYNNASGCSGLTATSLPVNVISIVTPTITGLSSACAGSTGVVYTTEAGQTSYVWSISSGGTITSGGTATSNTATVTWNTSGAQSISVTYTPAGGCAANVTNHPVTVHALPVPTITGAATSCVGTTGVTYTTETGMTGYTWTISAGGTITAGSTTNVITVTWNTAGAQTVSVNYNDVNGCSASTATVKNVTVNALPVPTITGLSSVCVGTTGVTYTTESGMTGYTWTVSAGGTITAGSSTNVITVNWNTAGAQSVSVNYTNGNSCTASTATVHAVTVNALPVPTITGLSSVCVGTTGVTYTTEAAMTGYTWTVSAGGSITAGSATNVITVTWNTAGAQTVSVNYTNGNSCTAATATVHGVTVNPLPVPTITGAATACVGATGVSYTTESGMSGYTWTISAGGTITAGTTTNSITVTWNTAGAQSVSVNYTNGNGCTAIAATVKTVTVNALPVPTITGLSTVCAGTTGVTYTTEAAMSGYTWTISAGGTITAGSTTNIITVTWNTSGAQSVSVNYTNGNSCTASSATVHPVTVNPSPVPSITGLSSVCVGTTGVTYTTEAGMTGYTWTVSAGGSITAGSTTNVITVTWNTAGAQSVSVNYTSAGCTAATATVHAVTVNPLPVPTITGTATSCAGTTGVTYSTEAGMSAYTWTISAGGTITAGSATNTITVTWNAAGAQSVSVNYTNGNGCTASTATVKPVTVNALPVPTITGLSSVCAGTTGVTYTTEAAMSGYTWTISAGGTITAGSATNVIMVTWNTAGAQSVSVNYTNGNGCTAGTATVHPVTVNPLPVPTITGLAAVCAGTTGVTYTTEAAMTGYTWTVSAGGSITAGSGTNVITVTWNTAGAQTVSVNYTNGNSCTAASATVKSVTVNAIPVVTISGSASVCVGTTGVVYTTQTGMTNYTWLVSAGGTITAGGTTSSNTATVTWNTAGAQTISVNYTNAGNCSAVSATVYPVTVNPLPVPALAGPSPVCVGVTGNLYTTDAGMTNYLWSVSSGGSITAGGGLTNNTITITWTTSGAKTVSVDYTNANGCTAAALTTKNVTVNSLPVPTITGLSTVCAGTTGVTYTTETGMSGYTWTVSAGGTITAGATTNAISVTWNTAGANTVSVNYTNGNSCTAATATVHNVTVNALPVPTLTGPTSPCHNVAGNVYTTEAGQTNYVWTVSAGGSITAGGTSGSNTVTVTWNTVGAQTVTVNYTNAALCTAVSATSLPVNVVSIVTPALAGLTTVCAGTTGVVYTTDAGQTNYAWSISAGGTITSGGTATSNTATVTWNSAGAQSISITFTSSTGCSANLTNLPVTVNALPVPTISGPTPVCATSTGNVYTTQAGMTGYTWAVSAGGTITAGGTGTSNTATVTWNTAGAQTVSVNYSNANSCSAASPVIYPVTVNALPVPTITGPAAACVNSTGNVYTTQAGMTSYV